MANLLGYRLNRLVRERDYLSGELPRLEAAVRKAQAQLETETTCLDQMLSRIADVDQSIRQLSGIDPAGIASIRATPRMGLGQFGDIRKTLIDILKEEDGPITTVELIQRMAPIFGWDLTTARGRLGARDSVRRPLQVLKQWNVVERLPNHLTANQRTCGVWRWIGPSDTNEAAIQKKTADQ